MRGHPSGEWEDPRRRNHICRFLASVVLFHSKNICKSRLWHSHFFFQHSGCLAHRNSRILLVQCRCFAYCDGRIRNGESLCVQYNMFIVPTPFTPLFSAVTEDLFFKERGSKVQGTFGSGDPYECFEWWRKGVDGEEHIRRYAIWRKWEG